MSGKTRLVHPEDVWAVLEQYGVDVLTTETLLSPSRFEVTLSKNVGGQLVSVVLPLRDFVNPKMYEFFCETFGVPSEAFDSLRQRLAGST